MDYKVDKLSTQFVFNNPNQASACGCGESVLLTPATGEKPRRINLLCTARGSGRLQPPLFSVAPIHLDAE